MEFNDYQAKALQTAIYPGRGTVSGLAYTALGLCGEAGEVAEKVKKILRDSGGVVTVEHRALIVKELGDVLWYVATVASELGMTIEDCAVHNVAKLHDRMNRGKLQGSGDQR